MLMNPQVNRPTNSSLTFLKEESRGKVRRSPSLQEAVGWTIKSKLSNKSDTKINLLNVEIIGQYVKKFEYIKRILTLDNTCVSLQCLLPIRLR